MPSSLIANSQIRSFKRISEERGLDCGYVNNASAQPQRQVSRCGVFAAKKDSPYFARSNNGLG
jgi:hypothetical protein